MAVKRDYASFSKACARYLTPLVAPMGFANVGGISFTRTHGEWSDAFFLQQTAYGSGTFCVNVGYQVPGLYRLWRAQDTGGLINGGRLSQRGIGPDCWLPAATKEQLLGSLVTFATYLQAALPWFDRVTCLSDIADDYYRLNGLLHHEPMQWGSQLSAANYGFLLVLAGRNTEARPWLTQALALYDLPVYYTREHKFVHERAKGARVVKPLPELTSQRQAIHDALENLLAGAV